MSSSISKELLDLQKQIQKNKEYAKTSLGHLPNKMVDLADEINTLRAVLSEDKSPMELTKIHVRLGLDLLKYERWLIEDELRERGLTLTPTGHIKKNSTILTIDDARISGLLDGMDVERILLKEKLRDNGVVMTDFGRFISLSGKIRTIEDLKHLSVLDDNEIDILLQPSTKATSSVTSKKDLSSEDVKYLKQVMGKPLTLGLAELVKKQPRDPIHYLGHWLYKYRYNQEIDQIKKKEIMELEAEREKIRNEKLRLDMEYATKSCLLDIIFRAHDEVSQYQFFKSNSLESAEVEETESEDLDEEAKDVLGELPIPKKNTKFNK